MPKNTLKNISFIAAAGAVILAVPALSKASFFDTFWKRFERTSASSPSFFTGANEKHNGQGEPAPLYKPAADYENAVVSAVKKASPAVVAITISKNVPVVERCPINPYGDLPDGFMPFFGGMQFYGACQKGTKLQEVGGGSGFIITSDGYIVTNKHVVSDSAASYTVFTNDGKKHAARVISRDDSQDLAIVKIDASGLPAVDLGDSDSVDLGQTAIAIGNAMAEFRNTVSLGVVSGLSRTVTAGSPSQQEETIRGVIQTDAAINPGNSGGPLLNLRGEVIGINTAIASNAQNIGFAIPINKAKSAIASVRATGKIQAPFIGVRYIIITPEVQKLQNLKAEQGALLRGSTEGPAVVPGSPADTAGLAAEDIITKVDGKAVDASSTLSDRIAEHKIGDSVNLSVLRKGEEITVKVKIGERP